MVDSEVRVAAPSEANDKARTDYGENLMIIPATNQIKELQTIIRDK